MKLGLGELFADMLALFQEHIRLVLAVIVMITLGYSVLDLVSERVSSIAGIIVSVFVQYFILERILADPMDAELSGRRFGSMLGSSILSGIGIVVGLVFLIVPGLYLAARWTLAPAFVVAEHRRAIESLSASWEATSEHVMPLMIAYLVGLGGMVVFGIGIFVGVQFIPNADSTYLEIGMTNLVTACVSMAGWLLCASAFRLMVNRRAALENVFA